MAEELPTPEIIERNSEGKATWLVGLGGVLTTVAVVGAKFVDSGAFNDWPIVMLIVGIFLGIAKAVGDYSASRPAKHHAMNEAAAVAAKIAERAGSTPNP